MDWPLVNGQHLDALGEGSGATYGTQINASGIPHNDGAWAQLGTVGVEAGGFYLYIGRLGSTGGPLNPFSGLIDIGYDPAGGTTYAVIVPDIYAATGGPGRGPPWWMFWPIPLQEGATVAARWRASTTTKNAKVTLYPVSFGWSSPFRLQQALNYGTIGGSSTATQIDPGGTANTKGGWVQLTSSTSIPLRHLTIVTHQENAAGSNANWRVDIGAGASGSEIVIVPDLLLTALALNDNCYPAAKGFWRDIPSGTRLAVQAACSITDATDRLFKAALYGVA